MPDLKIAIFFAKNRRKFPKIQNFAIRVLNIRISPGFLFIQKENGNSNRFCKFQHHSVQIFFKMANFKCLEIEKVASTPSPSDFDGLPYPRVRWYPQKMTAKDVKEITNMPLVTFFSVLERPGKNRKGVTTTPLLRRGLLHKTSQRMVIKDFVGKKKPVTMGLDNTV